MVEVEIEVLGVRDVLEGHLSQLLLGVPGQPGDGRVDGAPTTVQLDDRLADRRVLEGQSVALLRLTERLLGGARLGDVLGEPEPGHDQPRAVGHRSEPLREQAAGVGDVPRRRGAAQSGPVVRFDQLGRLGRKDLEDRPALEHLPAQPHCRQPEPSGREVAKVVVEGEDRALREGVHQGVVAGLCQHLEQGGGLGAEDPAPSSLQPHPSVFGRCEPHLRTNVHQLSASAVRREGAALDRTRFDAVATAFLTHSRKRA